MDFVLSGKSDVLDARAIAEAVLREAERLPRFEWSPEREAIRIRYDQRDRLVRDRTKHINRLRNAALRLDLKLLPKDLSKIPALTMVRENVTRLQGRDVATDALVDEALFAIEDITRNLERIAAIETLLRPLLRRVAPELLAIYGVSTIIAAGLIGHAGNPRNIRDAAAFAMRCGTAPVSWSSGRNSSVRINTGGNRQLNRLLHMVALCQLRSADHVGRIYYDRKRAEGKTRRSALRSLKRQLSTVVYFRLRQCRRPKKALSLRSRHSLTKTVRGRYGTRLYHYSVDTIFSEKHPHVPVLIRSRYSVSACGGERCPPSRECHASVAS